MTTSHVGEGFHITATPQPVRAYVVSLWRSRRLIRMLARRDFFVRYRRPTFGMLWLVGVPLIHAVVLATIFSYFVRFETGTSFAAFVLAGIIPWQFFSTGVNLGAGSITAGSSLASKVYFPRAVFPLVAVGSNLYGFVPSVALVILISLVLGVPIGLHIFLLVPAVALMVVLTMAFALVLGGLNVYFRDVSFMVQAVMIAWFYGSAVFFPIDVIPGTVQDIVVMNPATGMVQLFRSAIIGVGPRLLESVYWSIGWAVALLVVGTLIHRRYDRVYVDLL